jgi:hypothetical protein
VRDNASPLTFARYVKANVDQCALAPCLLPPPLLGCSSTTFSVKLTASLRALACHFKTDLTETVAALCLRANR